MAEETYHGWKEETGTVPHGPYQGHPYVRLTKKGREDVLTIGRVGISTEIMRERARDSAMFQEVERAEGKDKKTWEDRHKQANTAMRVQNRLRGVARSIAEAEGLPDIAVGGVFGDITS